jgi:hypothetical protein
MATATEARERRPQGRTFRERWIDPVSPRSLALWFGLGGPPLAWATNLVLGDLIFELGCAPGVRTVRGRHQILGLPLAGWTLIETAFLTGVIVAAGLTALWAWRQVRDKRGIAVSRAKALALGGIASSLFYVVLLAFGFLPTFFLHTCHTSL